MLTPFETALLDAACAAANQYAPSEWPAGTTLFAENVLTISFSDDYRSIKVTLHGEERKRFDDWYEGCLARCGGRDRPRSNREVPRLGDRIIFVPRRG